MQRKNIILIWRIAIVYDGFFYYYLNEKIYIKLYLNFIIKTLGFFI